MKRACDTGRRWWVGSWIQLDTAAGPVRAWLARPDKSPRGAVIVLQEIFGVNPHIRAVTDHYAEHGFVAMAPALFDPVQPDVELGYRDAGFTALVMDWDDCAAHHPEWNRHWRYHPQIAHGADGSQIGLLWSNTIAFQKLQRL